MDWNEEQAEETWRGFDFPCLILGRQTRDMMEGIFGTDPEIDLICEEAGL